MDLENKAE